MDNWISKSDFSAYRYLQESIKSEKLLDSCIKEAMLFDVSPLLGPPLFYEIANQINQSSFNASPPVSELSEANAKLLDGGSYTHNNKTIMFQGLKAALVYYAFARYTKRDGVHFTNSGPVIKANDFSEPISDRTRLRVSADDQAIADALRLEVIDFLNRNSADYPLWVCTTKKRKSQFKIIGN